jgi:DNA-binding MarR family transcriptional regulator
VHQSGAGFLVLHGLRLKGFSEPQGVADAVGLDVATVEEHLAKLQALELVLRRDGRLAGWALTAAGRAEQQRLAAADAAAAGATDVVRSGYERFLALNTELLGVCTDWQVRGGAPNDHGDAAYDAAVLERLQAIDARLRPVLDDLSAVRARYERYGPRFAAALAKLEGGQLEWFTKPLIDSYHTIWFELHEDLLSTLGIERSQEAPN